MGIVRRKGNGFKALRPSESVLSLRRWRARLSVRAAVVAFRRGDERHPPEHVLTGGLWLAVPLFVIVDRRRRAKSVRRSWWLWRLVSAG
jgi:hypothetical protein